MPLITKYNLKGRYHRILYRVKVTHDFNPVLQVLLISLQIEFQLPSKETHIQHGKHKINHQQNDTEINQLGNGVEEGPDEDLD